MTFFFFFPLPLWPQDCHSPTTCIWILTRAHRMQLHNPLNESERVWDQINYTGMKSQPASTAAELFQSDEYISITQRNAMTSTHTIMVTSPFSYTHTHTHWLKGTYLLIPLQWEYCIACTSRLKSCCVTASGCEAVREEKRSHVALTSGCGQFPAKEAGVGAALTNSRGALSRVFWTFRAEANPAFCKDVLLFFFFLW